jgi:hypothetical protein
MVFRPARVTASGLLLVVLLTGCRQNQRMQFYIDNLNAEKRVLEDELYELRYDYDVKLDELERLREQVGSGGSVPSVAPPRRDTSTGDAAGDRIPDSPSLQPPTIEFGDPNEPAQDLQPGDGGMPFEDPGPLNIDLGDEAQSTPEENELGDQTVTRLYLNPVLTAGKNQDGEPGDDGIRLVFEPRNDQNEFVRRPGNLTVVVLDPKRRTRVARWDFDAEQTALALQRAARGSGIQIDLPWQGTPPDASRLHLFVRYWPSNGEAVQADREITVTPPGQVTATWTPRSHPSPRNSEPHLSIAEKQPATGQLEPAPETDQNSSSEQSTREARDDGEPQQAELPEWKPYR